MEMERLDGIQVAETLTALRQELARLSERVAALEARMKGEKAAPVPAPVAAPTSSIAPAPPAISEELLVVISAAVAAFLGKKPHIRQIRLLGTTAWSQQGRVTIEASHVLSVRHARS